MKLLLAAALLACGIANATAESQYVGDCNVLIQTIRSTETWRDNGIPLAKIHAIIDRDINKTTIGPAATQNERDQWHFLVNQIFQGQKLDSDWVAESVGRFCKPPYSEIQKSYPAPQPTQRETQPVRVVDDKMTGCIFSGSNFQQAAVFRDHGLSPEEALRTMKLNVSGGQFGITLEFIKKAINMVYFDPGFSYAGGDALAGQIRTLCLRDWKPQFQPLK